MHEPLNSHSVSLFSEHVFQLKSEIKKQYDRNIVRDLSQQNNEYLFKRNVIAVLQQAYQSSLHRLQQLNFAMEDELSMYLLNSFDGFIDEVIQYALQKHRSSCALSNFPAEHNPPRDYIAEVIQETFTDWKWFMQQVDELIEHQLLLES